MPHSAITGRCLCGTIRYEYTGVLGENTWCHCETCRRASGAPAVAWVTMQLDGFRYTHGEPRQFASSREVVRTFCAGCGCSLTYKHEKTPDTLDMTVASLDDPTHVSPTDHIWMSDALAWDKPGDGLPQYPTWRSAP